MKNLMGIVAGIALLYVFAFKFMFAPYPPESHKVGMVISAVITLVFLLKFMRED